MIEGLPPELQEYLERVAEEIRGGGPPPKHAPIPERWMKLHRRVDCAVAWHSQDPNHPLVRIGRFDVLRVTGRGAFGLVFEARDPLLGRRVALKLCEVRDEKTAQRVLTEARLAARVNHDNVITVYDIDIYEEDLLFIVMEFATGKTAHHFASTGAPWQEILDVYLGAGAGLAAAHEQNVVHGDFKPDNVLVDEDGSRPRVADFGFARLRLRHTPEHEREHVRGRGARGFAAPEVLRGDDGDALSDQWAFCASVWRSLEGVLPFEAESTAGMLEVIERTRPRWVNPTVPETVRAVLERGLSADPADRFPSMEALVQALEYVRHTAVTPPQVSPDERFELLMRPPERRRRKGPGWGPVTAVFLFATVSLGVSTSQRLSAESTARGKGVRLLEPDPRLASASACAVTRAEKDHRVPAEAEGICSTIRLGEVEGAARMWQREYDDRLPEADGAPDPALALDSLIVARTFVSQAETFLLDGRRDAATKAAHQAHQWCTQAASVLGKEHAGVRWVLLRHDLIRTVIQPQHSTTPLPSMLP